MNTVELSYQSCIANNMCELAQFTSSILYNFNAFYDNIVKRKLLRIRPHKFKYTWRLSCVMLRRVYLYIVVSFKGKLSLRNVGKLQSIGLTFQKTWIFTTNKADRYSKPVDRYLFRIPSGCRSAVFNYYFPVQPQALKFDSLHLTTSTVCLMD
jgi:hypothetical protein